MVTALLSTIIGELRGDVKWPRCRARDTAVTLSGHTMRRTVLRTASADGGEVRTAAGAKAQRALVT
jgi:hypothetical protein